MTRSAEDTFAAHVASVSKGDVGAIVGNFAEDAVIITRQGVVEGRAAIETFFRQTLEALPQVELTATAATFHGDTLLLHWTASSPAGRVNDGVDTFIFANGLIRTETASFTLEPQGAI